jgi:hypothetical protein
MNAAGRRYRTGGELSASQFGVNQEAERIRQLALLHQPDQNRLPELG